MKPCDISSPARAAEQIRASALSLRRFKVKATSCTKRRVVTYSLRCQYRIYCIEKFKMLICAVCSKECDDASAIKCAAMCGVSANANCVKTDGKKNLRSNMEWRCKDCGNKTPTAGSAASASSGHSELTKDFIVKVMEAFKTEVFQELKSFKNDMLELTKSVQFISD
ncbi:hypothetical protein J6590_046907 [Homalodisca vitripennis]|nr:hypothetical protein J6590_046907 [Homalodisca vitripennis]